MRTRSQGREKSNNRDIDEDVQVKAVTMRTPQPPLARASRGRKRGHSQSNNRVIDEDVQVKVHRMRTRSHGRKESNNRDIDEDVQIKEPVSTYFRSFRDRTPTPHPAPGAPTRCARPRRGPPRTSSRIRHKPTRYVATGGPCRPQRATRSRSRSRKY